MAGGGRTGGQTDGRTGGQVDGWPGGQAGGQASGLAGRRADKHGGGQSGRIEGQAGGRVGRLADRWAARWSTPGVNLDFYPLPPARNLINDRQPYIYIYIYIYIYMYICILYVYAYIQCSSRIYTERESHLANGLQCQLAIWPINCVANRPDCVCLSSAPLVVLPDLKRGF